jgi:hypothetical protein|tara:strand:+ start:658 stop:825 length:168 start_codon:yes stop_codon:yes gene_type:complete
MTLFTHDPNHGDNTTCDLCKDVFDARNSHYEVINNKWICWRCLDIRDEEMIHDGL